MFNYSDIKGGVNPLRGGLPPLGQDDNFATRIQSLFLGTARVGYAWNNVLLYAKGGYAAGEVKVAVVDNAGVNQGARRREQLAQRLDRRRWRGVRIYTQLDRRDRVRLCPAEWHRL